MIAWVHKVDATAALTGRVAATSGAGMHASLHACIPPRAVTTEPATEADRNTPARPHDPCLRPDVHHGLHDAAIHGVRT
jgi:hypothetical protein